MKSAFKMAGTIGGYLGTIICLASIAGRFYGQPMALGWDASHLILLGMAVLLMACWAKLEAA